jgi:hypothetical protein
MAIQVPLVMSDGKVGRLAAGDQISGAIPSPQVSLLNGNAGALTEGMAVYSTAVTGTVDKARANASGTSKVTGLVVDATVAAGAPATIQYGGVLTIADWTVPAGSATLTPGATYFLSPTTAGLITPTPPNTTGQFVTVIGTAISTTALKIEIDSPIGA